VRRRPCHDAYCAAVDLINRYGARLRQACPRARVYHRPSIGLPLHPPLGRRAAAFGPCHRLPTRLPRYVCRWWSSRCTNSRPATTPPLQGTHSHLRPPQEPSSQASVVPPLTAQVTTSVHGLHHMIRLFCITILYHNLLCYSLIYFIFRDDTYVIFLYFACLIIIGEFTIGVRILLEKGLSRYNISEDQKLSENT
jgi:hypothetical protein